MTVFTIIVGIATILSAIFSGLALKNTADIKNQLNNKVEGENNTASNQHNTGNVHGNLNQAGRDMTINTGSEKQKK